MDPKEPNLEPEDLLVHDGWVRALVRRLVYDPAEADELAQETWLAALQVKRPR
jgi:DNA-directed RNA polymerase specialized sigma24 family protein